MPSSWQVRMTRTAISPRFAIRTLLSTRRHSDSVLIPERVRDLLGPSTRFTEIEALTITDSTNRVVAARAGGGAPEGLVVVAERQTAGRGRLDRSWEADVGAAL